MTCHYTHEVMWRKKETGSQMKGMQKESEVRDRGSSCERSDTNIHSLSLVLLPICHHICSVLTAETDDCLHMKAKIQNHTLESVPLY